MLMMVIMKNSNQMPRLRGVSALDAVQVTPYVNIEMHSYVHSEDVTTDQMDEILQERAQYRVGTFNLDEAFYRRDGRYLGTIATGFVCKVSHGATNKNIAPTIISDDQMKMPTGTDI